MPSPICEVKDGAGAYTSTTSGKNVTPANTVTIRLASTSGVGPWLIQCITTDNTSDAAAVTASLTVDQVAKTATFTAPAAGKAYRFKSTVNNGIDANGIAQASYSTTFGVYTLTATTPARRVLAVDETFESDATFGWSGTVNDLIRNPPGTTFTTLEIQDTSSTHQFIFSGASSELAADRTVILPLLTGNDTLVFEAHTQTISNKTIAAPTITGAVTMTGATTNTMTSSDGKVVVIDAVGSVQTTDATVTSLYTSATLTDEAVHSIDAVVTAIKSDGTAAAQYKRHYAGRRDGGTFTQLAAVVDNSTEETTSTWDVTVDVSSNTFRVRVTGVAANTIRWGYAIRHQATIP
jgi:hypothetical protein